MQVTDRMTPDPICGHPEMPDPLRNGPGTFFTLWVWDSEWLQSQKYSATWEFSTEDLVHPSE